MVKIKAVVSLGLSLIVPVLLIALVVLATRFAAAASEGSAGIDRQASRAGRLMAQTQVADPGRVGIPRLDLNIPAKTETATFALG